MAVKAFYTIGDLIGLSGFSRKTVEAMLVRHNVKVTEITAGKRPKRVVMLSALKEAWPDLFKSIMAMALANGKK